MGFYAIVLSPRFDPRVQLLWQSVLPYELRLEAEPSGPGFLDADLRYLRTPADAAVLSVRMRRWTLLHDDRNGRILRLTFPETRPEPRAPYDEFVDALRAINLAYASATHGAEPYRLGLAMGSKLLLGWLADDEEVLRPALDPPFSPTLA